MIGKLVANSEYVRKLMDTVSDAVISTDVNQNITFWNRAAEELYGWTAEEAIGKPMSSFVPMEFIDTTRDEVIAEGFSKGFWRGEVITTTKSGERIHVEASTTMIRDDSGTIIGWVGITRDITDSVQMNELEKSIATMIRAWEADKLTEFRIKQEKCYQNLVRMQAQFFELASRRLFVTDEDIMITNNMNVLLKETMHQMDELRKLTNYLDS